MADPVRELFEEFRTGQIDRINKSIAQREAEHSFLDFKRNTDDGGRSTGGLQANGKKVFAKVASAFANANGGVIVWGIKDKEDRASSKEPIPDVAQFKVQLDRETAHLISPPLAGVEHIAICEPDEDGKGYAVTYIPDGKIKPHMSTAKDQHTYFLRSGSNSMLMPDSAVRAFVQSGHRPILKLSLQEVSASITPESRTRFESDGNPRGLIRYTLCLENVGGAIAEDCALAIEKSEEHTILFRNDGEVEVGNSGQSFTANFVRLVNKLISYPDTTMALGNCEWRPKCVSIGTKSYRPVADLSLRYYTYARNCSDSGLVLIRADDILIHD